MLSDLVLVILADGRPRQGYALVSALCASSVLIVDPGDVQRELRRLFDQALIEVVSAPPSVDSQRALYRITPAGRDAACAWLSAPLGGRRTEGGDPLSFRLAALDAIPRDHACVLVDRMAGALAFRRQRLIVERSWAVGVDTEGAAALLYERELRHLDADREVLEMARVRLAGRATVTAAA